jgi:hypothetical protein
MAFSYVLAYLIKHSRRIRQKVLVGAIGYLVGLVFILAG